jgi:ABC-type branched-subunit amino acid transport system substrate-binding protein
LPDRPPDEPAAVRPARTAEVKVALLLPLTGAGTTAPIAKGLKQAAEMALIEQGGSAIQLVVKDDAGTPEGARAAAEEAIKDGAELILGPLFAKSVEAVAPLARQAGVPVIAFSNDRRVAGASTYLLSFLAEQEVERIVGHAVAQGKRRFAALVPDDAYGKVTEAAFRAAVSRQGGTISAVETYAAGANSMLEPVRRTADAIRDAEAAGQPIDALFIPASVDALASLGPQLAYAKIDPRKVQLLGTGGWDTPQLGKDAVFVGGWYPAPDPRGWRDFSERFAKTFGSPAPRIATLAHDAMGIAVALSTGPAKGRFTSETLTRPSGFGGIDGPVRLLADGTADRRFAILEVQKFGASLVEPAPAAFATQKVSSTAPRVN